MHQVGGDDDCSNGRVYTVPDRALKHPDRSPLRWARRRDWRDAGAVSYPLKNMHFRSEATNLLQAQNVPS